MDYSDPKNDLTFKKVFGEDPDLLKSLLNALLPLKNTKKEFDILQESAFTSAELE